MSITKFYSSTSPESLQNIEEKLEKIFRGLQRFQSSVNSNIEMITYFTDGN